MIVSLLFPSWQRINATTGESVVLNAVSMDYIRDGAVVDSTPSFYIAILAVASALVAFYSISRFKNRLLQIKLGALNSLLMAGVLVAILLLSRQGEKLVTSIQENASGFAEYQTGFYLVVAAMICNLLANRFIRRDESLVRSADRMR